MELGKLLVAFFITIIFLTLLGLFTSKGQAGQLIIPSNNMDMAFAIIILSSIVIFFIKVPKKYYRPIPSRA